MSVTGYIPPAQRYIKTRKLCDQCTEQPCDWHLHACRRIVSPSVATCECKGEAGA